MLPMNGHPDAAESDVEFDVAEMDTLTRSVEGVKMPLVDIRTGLPKRHRDGSPVTITLQGRQSAAFRDTLHQIQQKRAADRANNAEKPVESETERREREDRLFLIACTVDWSFKSMDRLPFPCTPANVRKFWHDPRFRTVSENAIAFIMADANFLAASAANSGNTQDTSSSSAVLFPRAPVVSATYSEATG
jgi:hypothetical protein